MNVAVLALKGSWHLTVRQSLTQLSFDLFLTTVIISSCRFFRFSAGCRRILPERSLPRPHCSLLPRTGHHQLLESWQTELHKDSKFVHLQLCEPITKQT